MKRSWGVAAALVILFSFAGPAMAQETAAAATGKEARVRELLALMRAAEMGMQVFDSMLATMKEAAPQLPEEFWTSFRQKVKSSDLVDMLVPVYTRNLESSDIDEMIRFFRTPAGQHFLEKQPVIMQESMEVGQKWGETLALQVYEEMQKQKKE